LVLSTKRLVAAAKFLVAATKILFVVRNFVAVTKPLFSVQTLLVARVCEVSCHAQQSNRRTSDKVSKETDFG